VAQLCGGEVSIPNHDTGIDIAKERHAHIYHESVRPDRGLSLCDDFTVAHPSPPELRVRPAEHRPVVRERRKRRAVGFLCAALTDVRYSFYAPVSLAITGCCEKVCYLHIAHACRASGRTHPAPASVLNVHDLELITDRSKTHPIPTDGIFVPVLSVKYGMSAMFGVASNDSTCAEVLLCVCQTPCVSWMLGRRSGFR
jgi:hypothetical protein